MAEEEEQKRKTPHTALIEALEKVDEMEDVLIIWDCKGAAKMGSVDSDMTVAEALYHLEMFRHWLLSRALGD